LRCGYCLQDGQAKTAVRRKGVASEFVNKVAPILKKKSQDNLHLWGGEPLLYWPQIRDVVLGLRAEGISFGMTRMSTNGTLLTPTIVDELNALGIYVVVSPHLTQQAPNWDLVSKLRNSSLHFMFSHQELEAWSWLNLVQELEQKYSRPFFPDGAWIKATETTPKEYWFTESDLEKHRSHLLELADLYVQGDRHVVSLLGGAFLAWNKLKDKTGPVQSLCHADDHIAVDLDGNRYGCHHTVDTSWRTGTLGDEGSSIEEQSVIRFTRRFISTDACQSCELKHWCRGHCHRSQTHDIDCQMRFIQDEVYRYIQKKQFALEML
jgi:radical SAM protein with 4Fe4S-binding SPASM domain